jgi:ethanolamine utilization microcompartment shell protein EutS
MNAQELDDLVDEARRMIQEAVLTGQITLVHVVRPDGTHPVVELGTKKADAILRTAENLTKQRPMKHKRINTDADFIAPNTEG